MRFMIASQLNDQQRKQLYFFMILLMIGVASVVYLNTLPNFYKTHPKAYKDYTHVEPTENLRWHYAHNQDKAPEPRLGRLEDLVGLSITFPSLTVGSDWILLSKKDQENVIQNTLDALRLNGITIHKPVGHYVHLLNEYWLDHPDHIHEKISKILTNRLYDDETSVVRWVQLSEQQYHPKEVDR